MEYTVRPLYEDRVDIGVSRPSVMPIYLAIVIYILSYLPAVNVG